MAADGRRRHRRRSNCASVGLRYFVLEGETEALSNVSLSVAPGEFVAIIGPSGCGKSTLLSLISGILAPTEGAVLVDGRPVTGPSRKVGYMLQQDYLFEWRTILENAVLGRRNPGRADGQGARTRDPASDPLRARPVPEPPAAPALRRHAPARRAWRARCAPSPTSCCSTSRFRRSTRRRGWRSPTRSPKSCGARPRP